LTISESPDEQLLPEPELEPESELDHRPVGEIISINGTCARILMAKGADGSPRHINDHPYVGTIVIVDTGAAIVLCLITAMTIADGESNSGLSGNRVMEVELVGELPRQEDNYLCTFRRGVSVYPRLGENVWVPSRKILEKAYYFGSFDSVEIGRLHQDPSIPAVIKINEMLGKHFAIVGSTGTGKSCAVALILREFLAKQPKSHIVLVDPHNEYNTSFDDRAHIINLNNLCLPFWFLNFEEIVEIVLGGAEGNGPEIELLREFIPAAKRQFAANRGRENRLLQKSVTRSKERYSVDVPVPYRISDLISQLRNHMGMLEIQKDLRPFKHLISRIEAVTQDPRYSFMFGNMMVEDNLGAILKQIFRIPVNGKPITIVQLVGLPAEIVNVIVSILARLAFDLALWSEGKMPITFVCEEAHRYVPREKDAGFEPTKKIISRIAKEGRKYGIALCVVSQRPGDIDPTILSQCSTIFSMRLSNERDRTILKSAVSDAAESLLRFLPSLSTGESIVFGEGVTLPSRIMLAELPESALPKGAGNHLDAEEIQELDPAFVDEAIMHWRSVGSDIESLLPPEPAPAPVEQVAPSAPAAPASTGHPNNGGMVQPAQVPIAAQPAQSPAPAPTAAHATQQRVQPQVTQPVHQPAIDQANLSPPAGNGLQMAQASAQPVAQAAPAAMLQTPPRQ
jgi:DNA helicase HerA-like ATPase